mmetsp:Transcript_12163/g.12004  ORF Transcript_12163/g.12004 Transcript_12163/m.12004 type:complete len:147 (-) Transcript_12163:50-490(-)
MWSDDTITNPLTGVPLETVTLHDFANHQNYIYLPATDTCEVKYVPFNVDMMKVYNELLDTTSGRAVYMGKRSPYGLTETYYLWVVDLATFETPYPTRYNVYADMQGDIAYFQKDGSVSIAQVSGGFQSATYPDGYFTIDSQCTAPQ